MENKFYSFLGLSRKAGKLILGYDNIEKKPKLIKLLILSYDAADRTKKNVLALNKPYIITDMQKKEFGHLMGVGEVSVAAVIDDRFAEQLILYGKKE